MISKKKLCAKLDEINHYIEQNENNRAKCTIQNTKQMIENSEDKPLVTRLLRLCNECLRDGYNIGINETKQNRRKEFRQFFSERQPGMKREIKQMM